MAMQLGDMAKRFRTNSENHPRMHMPSQKRGIQNRSL